MDSPGPKSNSRAVEVRDRLVERLGEIIPLSKLWRELGFGSLDAARKARQRGTLPVQVFKINGRRGYFARTTDLAGWLAQDELDQGGSL